MTPCSQFLIFLNSSRSFLSRSSRKICEFIRFKVIHLPEAIIAQMEFTDSRYYQLQLMSYETSIRSLSLPRITQKSILREAYSSLPPQKMLASTFKKVSATSLARQQVKIKARRSRCAALARLRLQICQTELLLLKIEETPVPPRQELAMPQKGEDQGGKIEGTPKIQMLNMRWSTMREGKILQVSQASQWLSVGGRLQQLSSRYLQMQYFSSRATAPISTRCGIAAAKTKLTATVLRISAQISSTGKELPSEYQLASIWSSAFQNFRLRQHLIRGSSSRVMQCGEKVDTIQNEVILAPTSTYQARLRSLQTARLDMNPLASVVWSRSTVDLVALKPNMLL